MSQTHQIELDSVVAEVRRHFNVIKDVKVEVCGAAYDGPDNVPLQVSWKGKEPILLDEYLDTSSLPATEKLSELPLRAVGNAAKFQQDWIDVLNQYFARIRMVILLPELALLKTDIINNDFFSLDASEQNEQRFADIHIPLLARWGRMRFQSITDPVSLSSLFASQTCLEMYKNVKPKGGIQFRQWT